MIFPPAKSIDWVGSSLDDIRSFPEDARQKVGRELRRVQRGLPPHDWKPMKSIGPGVREIRVHTRIEHRVIFVASFEEAIYVLHAFQKRSQKTAQTDINIARRRLAQVLQERG